MKAITTKQLLSATKGIRYKASDNDVNSIIVPNNPRLDPRENHMAAAIALANKMQWRGTLQGGRTGSGFVWTFDDKDLIVEV